VRRAAAGVTSTVSSTVSSVAQVASGKRRHDSHGGRQSFYESNLLTNAKEKYTMTVKVHSEYFLKESERDFCNSALRIKTLLRQQIWL
jgi:hypothetical protein